MSQFEPICCVCDDELGEPGIYCSSHADFVETLNYWEEVFSQDDEESEI